MSDIQKRKLLHEYENKRSLKDLCHELSLSKPTLVRILNEEGKYEKREMGSTHSWTYKKVKASIIQLSEKLGRAPKASEWNHHYDVTCVAIMRKFNKSWNDIIVDCKLKPNIEYLKWNKQSLRNAFLKLLKTTKLFHHKKQLNNIQIYQQIEFFLAYSEI